MIKYFQHLQIFENLFYFCFVRGDKQDNILNLFNNI